jgi:16S rRNA (cytidine1402-2'-O)-methyltransferase
MTRRAIQTLGEVDLIACEDTRQTLKLLNHFGIQKPLTSYHQFNEEKKSEELAAKLSGGAKVALVSDACTPGVSDPGYRLVRLCQKAGIPIVAVPGANAAVAAVSASGLPCAEFMFLGFLPSKRKARLEKLNSLLNITCTLIFYEAPHRIAAALEDLQTVFGDREVCIAREITKIHEEYLFGSLSEVKGRVKELGEFVIVVAGAMNERKAEAPLTREEALRRLGMTRNQLYDLFFEK